MNIDNGFVSALLLTNPDGFKKAIRSVSSDMLSGTERMVFDFIKKYYKESKGKFPSRKALVTKFSDFELIKPSDSLEFYCGELRDREEYQQLTEGITDIQNNLLGKDIESAKKRLHKIGVALSKIELQETQTAFSAFEEQLQTYEDAKKNKGIIGLQTRIDAIDKRIGGIQDEMFIILAKRGTGKTFLSLMMLGNIWAQLEGPVVFVSNEMSPSKIIGRTNSVVGKFSYSKYRKGQLDEKEEKRLKKLPKIYKNRHPLYVISGSGKHVDEIEMEIAAIEPTFLIVDGLYLTDMGFNDPWRDTLMASRAYQRITKRYNLPAIITSQLNEDNAAKYSKALEEDADIVLKMYQNAAMKSEKMMGIDFMKIREEDSDLKAYLNWDFANWDFHELDFETADQSAEKTFEE